MSPGQMHDATGQMSDEAIQKDAAVGVESRPSIPDIKIEGVPLCSEKRNSFVYLGALCKSPKEQINPIDDDDLPGEENYDGGAVHDAFKFDQFPTSWAEIPRLPQTAHSVVTDLGYSRVAPDHTLLYDSSDTGLCKRLSDAMVEPEGKDWLSFLPRTELYRLVNPVTINKEFSRFYPHPMRRQEQLALSRHTGLADNRLLQPPQPTNWWDVVRNVVSIAPPGHRRKIGKKICGLGPRRDRKRRTEGRGDRDEGHSRPIYLRVFAILTLMCMPLKILDFLRDKVSDSDLPLVKVEKKMYRRKNLKEPLRCFDGWNRLRLSQFIALQWSVSAQVFTAGSDSKPVSQFVIPEMGKLPFTMNREVTDACGSGGEIRKVRIHPGHHNFQTTEGENKDCFAIKRLFNPTKKSLQRETILSRYRDIRNNPHIMKLLAIYEHRNQHFLLFNWADMNLHDYWTKHETMPTADSQTIIWIASECAGIAAGLAQIHTCKPIEGGSPTMPSLPRSFSLEAAYQKDDDGAVFARSRTDWFQKGLGIEDEFDFQHGDIKAHNILLCPKPTEDYPGPYQLRIADFGLSGSWVLISSNARSTATYEPPERSMVTKGGGGAAVAATAAERHNFGDVWALGCLYLEFITWYLGGAAKLEELGNIRGRRFYEVEQGTSTPVVKPAVVQFIQDLPSHPRSSNFINEFLKLIEDDALVARTRGLSLRGDELEECRKSSTAIRDKLRNMLRKCQEDVTYIK